jgi:hypothetical protein
MRIGLALAALAALVVFAKPAMKPAPPLPRPPPLAPLAMTPSVGRVKVGVHGGALVVVEEVTLPRGEWKGEALAFHVAFGAPGAPKAIDAHLVPIGDGALEADDDAAGEPLQTDRVPRRPPTAHPLLGRDAQAGVVVHLGKDALEHAFAPAGMAALRIRSVLEVPELDPQGARSVLVRLGALALGRIVVTSKVARAEAHLCGPEADAHALSLSPHAPAPTNGERPLPPIIAPRHASDDLCVRLWE